MRQLSISAAWDDAKTILQRDGQLFTSVALALVALPLTISGAVSPTGLSSVVIAAFQTGSSLPLLLVTVFLLITLTGQLAITRLAIGPSISVGAAITQATRRLPSYISVAFIMGLAMTIALIIVAMVIGATLGEQVTQEQVARSPLAAVAALFLLSLYLFLFTRIIALTAAVTSTESLSPIHIIKRSWSLSSGHSWRLFGFLITFMLGTGIALYAVAFATGSVVQLVLGPVRPLSTSALVLSVIGALASSAVSVVFAVMLARIYLQLSGSDGAQASVPRSGI